MANVIAALDCFDQTLSLLEKVRQIDPKVPQTINVADLHNIFTALDLIDEFIDLTNNSRKQIMLLLPPSQFQTYKVNLFTMAYFVHSIIKKIGSYPSNHILTDLLRLDSRRSFFNGNNIVNPNRSS
jgi:hypothetical protein